ncbi:hypothetical protein [Vermiculatibacterium agrestimuris]|uniref:hypothetical protein n=1 Tax=Vermiculatibacterium agrestimuris TaxID=2941519 RepID=UPI00203DF82B|nr:hypothetical protein [Vermiculatibacterium agrestimuris]
MSMEAAEKKKTTGGGWEALWCVAFLVTAALLLHLAGAVLRPLHLNYGSTWEQYLAEPRDSIDVLFLGSSYAYCDWNPGVMYGESGLTGYVMGGSEQVPAITYWYLKEALKTQSPSVVVMEASSLFFDRYRNYTQINLGYMPWGWNRVQAILECAEPEKKLGLFFDLYFYHDRWKELTAADVKKLIPAGADHWKGHTAVDEVFPALEYSQEPFLNELTQSEEVLAANMADFARIAALCREEGIDLIVTVNPTYSQYPQAVYDKLEAEVTANEGVRFVDWRNGFEEIGLDVSRHLYDGGHLNQDGAKIFSAYTGRFLRALGYAPRPQTEENRAAWEAAVEYWEELL